jgi:hypothetical protein
MWREFTEEEREWQRYQARLKWERDQTAFFDEARMEGQEKGEWIGRIQMGQDLLGLPLTAKAELAALAVEELKARARTLEQQIRAGKN